MTSPRSLWSRLSTRRLAAATVVLTLGLSAVGSTVSVEAQTDSEAARQAAREIQAARDRANEAAQALFDAESLIDTLSLEIAEAQQELTAVEAESSEMRRSLESSAVRRFTQSGGSSFILLGDLDEASDELTAEVLTAVTVEAATVELDDFDAVIKEVDEARARLERRQAEAEQASIDYAALQQRTEDEIARLIEVEERRQIDEAIERELQRQREERTRQDAVAAQATANRQSAASASAASSSSSSGSSGSSGDSSSSSGSSGGSTGSGSSGGSAPPATSPPSNAGRGMTCPIRGNYAFADTWGAPRSGGRRHQGVDMIAPSGTTLVAAESGTVRFSTNRLGGNAAWVTGNSGTKYYYAHLLGFTGGNRSVSQGEQIGTVGQTGNAGTPHLHLQIHPGGGTAVNPYPYVRAVC
ncbi:peptidoglycan DD-metalloendopeptidase family protein [uncultured Ilumatobacter sp.]|uniref:peptidoglycan DD-metalloendopeptidase family protein n=1 Tax=uncultured Ilumatobacter sp. TaxID=879968 RepID=UPI00374E6ED2